jgi:hypothetical protein
LANVSRPDLSYAVSALSRYAADPADKHAAGVKYLLRYLRGTSSLGLLYKRGTGDLATAAYVGASRGKRAKPLLAWPKWEPDSDSDSECDCDCVVQPVPSRYCTALVTWAEPVAREFTASTAAPRKSTVTVVGYADSDYAGDRTSRKSRSAYTYLLNGAPVCWSSKLQTVVALSTCKAEYTALADAAREAVWLREILNFLGQDIGGDLQLLCDNEAAVCLATGLALSSKTKHIAVRSHFIRNAVAHRVVTVSRVDTKENISDVLTKALPSDTLVKLRSMLGVL